MRGPAGARCPWKRCGRKWRDEGASDETDLPGQFSPNPGGSGRGRGQDSGAAGGPGARVCGSRLPETGTALSTKRKAELAFLEEFFSRVVDWCEASEDLVAVALAEAGTVPLSAVDAIHVAAAKQLKADELITAERPDKPLHKVRGLKVCFLPNA